MVPEWLGMGPSAGDGWFNAFPADSFQGYTGASIPEKGFCLQQERSALNPEDNGEPLFEEIIRKYQINDD